MNKTEDKTALLSKTRRSERNLERNLERKLEIIRLRTDSRKKTDCYLSIESLRKLFLKMFSRNVFKNTDPT